MPTTPSRRAMLFVPGNSTKMLAKIPDLAPASFILDLEDSVPDPQKAGARDLVGALTREVTRGYELHVRINEVNSEHAAHDVAAVMGPGLAGVVVPKVECAADVERVNVWIDEAADSLGRDARDVGVIATIETARGLHHVHEIAAAGGHLEMLGFGSGDFALDVGLEWPSTEGTPEILLWAKVQLVLASRVAGLAAPHDGSFTDYRDLEGLAREARESRRQGFGGKHVVHPSQIPVVDRIFRPDARQVVRARRIVSAFEEAERSGRGTVGVEGELVDYAIVKRARQLLAELDPPG